MSSVRATSGGTRRVRLTECRRDLLALAHAGCFAVWMSIFQVAMRVAMISVLTRGACDRSHLGRAKDRAGQEGLMASHPMESGIRGTARLNGTPPHIRTTMAS